MNSKGIFSKLLTGGMAGLAIMSTVYIANPNVAIADKTTISEAKDGFSQINSKDAPFEIYSATISGRPANGHIHTEDGVTIHASNPVNSKELKIKINTLETSPGIPFEIESAKYGGQTVSVSTYNKDDGKMLIQGNLPHSQRRKGDSNKISVTLTFPQ